MDVILSLVLYRHSFDSVKPLLNSIQRVAAEYSGHSFSLVVYNARPHDLDDPTPERICRILGNLLSTYQYGENIGFGAANNRNFAACRHEEEFLFVVVNPDISFQPISLLPLLDWAASRRDVSCVAPLILNPGGAIQFSAKHDPTLASLLIGRFPLLMTIRPFEKYDRWHRNLDFDYSNQCIESTYLSGCFLLIPSSYYLKIGGFCEKYFLHLEDADIVRRLSRYGASVHNPIGVVEHRWARGSHHSAKQMLHLARSFIVYSLKWGMRLF
jgi:GT2 family glycosyltransferase